MPVRGPGFVYVYCNVAKPGIVKVGWSTKPDERAEALTGFIAGNCRIRPMPFGIYRHRVYAVPAKERASAERHTHNLLSDYRRPGPGELFHVCPAHALCAAWVAVTMPAFPEIRNERLAGWMYERFTNINRLKGRCGFRWEDYTISLVSTGLFGNHLTVDIVIKTWKYVRAQKEEDRKGRARAKYAADRQRLTKPICVAPPL